MSFVVPKLAWLVLQPSNLMLLGLLVATLLRWRRFALTILALLAFVVVLPVGLWLHQPLRRGSRARTRHPNRSPASSSSAVRRKRT